MDVREIVFRFPAKDRNLSQLQRAQNGVAAFLASHPNDSGSSVIRGKTDEAASSPTQLLRLTEGESTPNDTSSWHSQVIQHTENILTALQIPNI
jgi:hypothetical protein